VIVSYFEWVQDLQSFFWSETEVMQKLYQILDQAYDRILKSSRDRNITMRTAALCAGIQRVREAKHIRGLFP
jgi:glutamate dehydrogenase (NAD(P)+)